jgi:gliding motility-associated lipoprotein GldH
MKTIFSVVVLFLLVTSCDPYMVYDEYSKAEGGQWKWSDKKTFEANMTDSIGLYNILINIRHTTSYPKSNLFVFVTTTAPTGNSRRDTVEILIADDRGKWQGNGFSDVKLVSREYRKAIRFLYPGKYTFELEQGMRIPEIPVTDIGVRIEEFKDLR